MRKIIVGVDESHGSSDAIALASSLARITGSTLMLVNVLPSHHHASSAARDALLERLRSSLGDETIELRAIAGGSARPRLRELSREEDAGLVVVGSPPTSAAPDVCAHRRARARIALPGRMAPGLRVTIECGARDHRLRLRRLTVRRARAPRPRTASRWQPERG